MIENRIRNIRAQESIRINAHFIKGSYHVNKNAMHPLPSERRVEGGREGGGGEGGEGGEGERAYAFVSFDISAPCSRGFTVFSLLADLTGENQSAIPQNPLAPCNPRPRLPI